jgi:hypothetical protein
MLALFFWDDSKFMPFQQQIKKTVEMAAYLLSYLTNVLLPLAQL